MSQLLLFIQQLFFKFNLSSAKHGITRGLTVCPQIVQQKLICTNLSKRANTVSFTAFVRISPSKICQMTAESTIVVVIDSARKGCHSKFASRPTWADPQKSRGPGLGLGQDGSWASLKNIVKHFTFRHLAWFKHKFSVLQSSDRSFGFMLKFFSKFRPLFSKNIGL